MELPYYHAYVQMMIDGKPAKPFSVRVLYPDASEFKSHETEAERSGAGATMTSK